MSSYINDSNRDPSHLNIDWVDLYFPANKLIPSPGVIPVPSGPYGQSRLASSIDIEALLARACADPQQFVRLFEAYAIGHDPRPTVVACDALPVPLGHNSPNCLILGPSGAGKTQKGTLAAVADTIGCGHAAAFFNLKGKRQTRLIRKIAGSVGRLNQVKLLAPRKLDRTLGYTALEGCADLSQASEVAACMVAAAARNSRFGEGAWAYNQAEEWIAHAIVAICTDLPAPRHTLCELRRVTIDGDYKKFAEAHPNFRALAKFARYYENGNRNGETIAATISEVTAFIDGVAACLSANEITLADFARSGGILIIEIDEHDIDSLRSFCTLVLGRLLSALQREACASPSGALPGKTVIVIDELAASGPVPGLPHALHTCRERGYYFFAGTQSVAQLSAIYGPSAEVVLAGFQSLIALSGGLDIVTADYLSRKSGATTIAVPTFVEQFVAGTDGVPVTRSWTLACRSLLLPSDIGAPSAHPILGSAATIFLGDGTPPFQAYLKPAHEVGWLSRLIDEVSCMTADDDRRHKALIVPEVAPPLRHPGRITNTDGWSDMQINAAIDETMKALDWDNTTGSARKWWTAFREENSLRLQGILRLVEELAIRRTTVTEFFLSYVYSNTDSIEANLCYLDYVRLKREEERQKRDAAQKRKADLTFPRSTPERHY